LVLVEAGIKILDDLQLTVDAFVEEIHDYALNAIDPATGIVRDIYSFPAIPKASSEMLKALDAAINRRVNSTKMLSDQASELAGHSKNITIMLLVIALFFSVGFGFFLTISITHPLKIVVQTLSDIERGDMTVRANLNRNDELGILSRALDGLSAKLQTIFRNLRQSSNSLAISSGELSNVSKLVAKESISGAIQINNNAVELVRLSGDLKNILRQFRV